LFWIKIYKRGVLLLIVILSVVIVHSQGTNLDSLGNIWIITVDKSGSMLWNSQQQYTYGNRIPIASSVARRLLDKSIFNQINYDKDRFLFFNSGILQVVDLNQLKSQSRFDTSFIHHTDATLHSFKDQKNLVAHIKSQLERGDYVYTYSFVSQIRLFSIIKGLDFIKEKNLTDNFNHLWLITITDDADQNDQWMNDFKTVKKFAPKKITDVNELTTKYLYNPFNSKSDISKSGTLNEKLIDESEIPHINFYEYKTTQSITAVADTANSFFSIQAVKDSAVNFKSIKSHFPNDSILFFYIESIVIDDSTYLVRKYFTDTITIPAKLTNWFKYNKILTSGYFQVQYSDSILGGHFKKYEFKQSATFPSTYLTNFIRRSEVTLLILLILLITYIIGISPRKKLFVVYDNQGRKFTGKKGSWLFGHYRYWKKIENSILSFVLNKGNQLNYIRKKHKNLIVQNHNFKLAETTILIVSHSQLSIDNNIKELTTRHDIEEYHEAKDYNFILKSVYRRSFQFQLFKIAKKLNAKNSPLFSGILSFSNLFFKRYYYLVTLTEKDFKNTSISFSCSNFKSRTFTIEFNSTKPEIVKDENATRNIACLNNFFSSESMFADGLLTVHLFDDHINWNVLKLDHQNSLQKVYHLFHFKQHCQDRTLINSETMKRNISLLLKLSMNGSTSFTNLKTYVTSSNGTSLQIQTESSIKLVSVSSLIEENKNSFTFYKSAFQNFLYLVEAKETEKRTAKQLYSPFINEEMPKTPIGDYHIYSCFAPAYVEKDFKEEYSIRIAENIFSFATKRDLQVVIDSNKKRLYYANHTINLNGF
jgi:hypothetical protein